MIPRRRMPAAFREYLEEHNDRAVQKHLRRVKFWTASDRRLLKRMLFPIRKNRRIEKQSDGGRRDE